MSHHVVSASECMRAKILVGCSEFPEPGADPDAQYDTEMAAAYSARGAEQTGRNHVARASDPRTLYAVEISIRLWRALGEAARHPQGSKAPT